MVGRRMLLPAFQLSRPATTAICIVLLVSFVLARKREGRGETVPPLSFSPRTPDVAPPTSPAPPPAPATAPAPPPPAPASEKGEAMWTSQALAGVQQRRKQSSFPKEPAPSPPPAIEPAHPPPSPSVAPVPVEEAAAEPAEEPVALEEEPFGASAAKELPVPTPDESSVPRVSVPEDALNPDEVAPNLDEAVVSTPANKGGSKGTTKGDHETPASMGGIQEMVEDEDVVPAKSTNEDTVNEATGDVEDVNEGLEGKSDTDDESDAASGEDFMEPAPSPSLTPSVVAPSSDGEDDVSNEPADSSDDGENEIAMSTSAHSVPSEDMINDQNDADKSASDGVSVDMASNEDVTAKATESEDMSDDATGAIEDVDAGPDGESEIDDAASASAGENVSESAPSLSLTPPEKTAGPKPMAAGLM
ncbi:MAG: hypothetical protein SGPRY_013443, partial [Prymnesium sp.]